MKRIMVQFAMDGAASRSLDEAVEIIDLAAPYVDIIEAGTSFILRYGIEAPRRFKKEFGSKIILADMKIMDGGYHHAAMGCDNGADIVTVMGAAHEDTMRHPFLYGLLTNLSNPKAVIYFGSIFSGLLSPDLPSWFTGGIFALVLLETFLWFGFVALVFGMENLRRGYRKAARWIDGFAGILFVGFGLSLIAAAAGLR